MKKIISERALLERIRRKLAKEGTRFLTNRGGAYSDNLPKYFAVDSTNGITNPATDDLVALGKEMGVLREWEALEPK